MNARKLFDGSTFEVDGYSFNVRFETDTDADMPWENDDGRGVVRKSDSRHAEGHSDKSPSERPLNQAGRNEYQFYYDWKTSLAKAKRDGWDRAPYGQPDGYIRAVEEDFQFIRSYLANDWEYVGVIVTLLDSDGEATEYTESCWGIESYKDYHCEMAHELADTLVRQQKSIEAEHVAQWHDDMATIAVRLIQADAVYAGL